MSRTLPAHRRRATLCLAAALLASPAHPAPDNKPAPPASVLASQQQHARWVAAFNAWRGAASTWSGETVEQARLRAETRLLLLPTPRPVLARQRWLGGRAVVVSSGLIALLEEMLLAEAVSGMPGPGSPGDCFTAYGARVLQTVNLNREAQAAQSQEPLSAWPRFSTLVEAGKARTIGERYETGKEAKARLEKRKKALEAARKNGQPAPPEVDETGGPCKAVTPALLRSGATLARIAENADALALWLFTQQNLELARLPSLARARTPDAAADAASAAKGGTSKNPRAADTAAPRQPAASEPRDACAALPGAAAPSGPQAARPASSASSSVQLARQAVCATGRLREPRTAEWLGRYLLMLDAGSSPPITSP